MATPKHPPTLREIARMAGVSHTTVSLALRNNPSIPSATRERIHRLADAMGYRSNALVSALMTQVRMRHPRMSAEVVGFLTGGPTAGDWKQHSAMLGFFAGASERALRLGMRVEAFWLGSGGEKTRPACRVLTARAIRGNLIAPFPVPVYSQELDWEHLTCVALGYAFTRHHLHRATHHHFHGSFTAFENLRRLGYARIGLMLDRHQNNRVRYTWLGGYLAAQTNAGGHAVEPLLMEDGSVPEVKGWIERARPDAVIGFGPQQLAIIRLAGYAVPGDLAFAALDIQQVNLASAERVAGIDQNLGKIGATAIDTLATLLYHNERGIPRVPVLAMIEGFWVDGETAPPRVGS